MNRASSRLLLCTFTSAVLVAAAGDAAAFPNPFKRKAPESAPAPTELAAAQNEAAALLIQGGEAENAGRNGSATSTYKRIVDRFPLTNAAPVALFRLAGLYERDGKFSKAFETYQELVDTYKQSPQFGEAIDRQSAIATQARSEKLGSFLGIPKKLDRSVQIEMFEKVISNAPRGSRAAEAQFEIAKIHEEDGSTDLAIAAYRKVVMDYPGSPLAAEAQAKVTKGYLGIVESGSRDASNLDKARLAADEAIGLFPDTSLPDFAETRVQVDEISAENAWKTGKFYEKQGNYRAALIYYSDVLRAPGGPNYAEARERINDMTIKDPTLLDSVPAVTVASRDLAVPAATDLKSRPGYFGPPPPPARIAANQIRKPSMRSGSDQIPITPIEEPDLPTGSDRILRPDDTLLNPGSMPAEPGDLIPGDSLPPLESPGAGAPQPAPPADPSELPPPSEPELPKDPTPAAE